MSITHINKHLTACVFPQTFCECPASLYTCQVQLASKKGNVLCTILNRFHLEGLPAIYCEHSLITILTDKIVIHLNVTIYRSKTDESENSVPFHGPGQSEAPRHSVAVLHHA